MFKFELNDTVYFLKNEKIHTGTVIARKYSDRIRNDPLYTMYTDGPQNDWIDHVLNGDFTEVYIVHEKGQNERIEANHLFMNDKELIDSLYQ